MSLVTTPTRGSSDLQAALTDTRTPAVNELSAAAVEKIKDYLIEHAAALNALGPDGAYTATVTTTDATPTVALTINPADGFFYQARCDAAYGCPTGPKPASATAIYTAAKAGGSAYVNATPYNTGSVSDAAISAATLVISASGGNILLTVTGVAATVIKWKVSVRLQGIAM